MIQLLIYAAMAAAALIAFHEFEQHYFVGPAEIRGAANQQAADQKIQNLTASDRDHWKAAEQAREGELADLTKQIDGPGGLKEQISKLSARGATAIAKTAAIVAAGQKKDAAAAVEKARLQAILDSKNKALGTAQEQLNRIDAENTRYLNGRTAK